MIQWLNQIVRRALLATLASALLPACATAESLEFIIDRADGAVHIKNPNASPVVFDGYQFISTSAAFDTAAWTSITDNYDSDGDQSVDSTSTWLKGTVSSSLVEEGSLQEQSASLAPGQIVSLGLFFNLGQPEHGLVNVFNGTSVEAALLDFRTLTADYDGDLDVDLDDYGVFADTFGSTVDLRADGNNDSVIDAADYTIWRDSEELSLTPAPVAIAFSLAIPEPSSMVSLLITAGLSVVWPATRPFVR